MADVLAGKERWRVAGPAEPLKEGRFLKSFAYRSQRDDLIPQMTKARIVIWIIADDQFPSDAAARMSAS